MKSDLGLSAVPRAAGLRLGGDAPSLVRAHTRGLEGVPFMFTFSFSRPREKLKYAYCVHTRAQLPVSNSQVQLLSFEVTKRANCRS